MSQHSKKSSLQAPSRSFGELTVLVTFLIAYLVYAPLHLYSEAHTFASSAHTDAKPDHHHHHGEHDDSPQAPGSGHESHSFADHVNNWVRSEASYSFAPDFIVLTCVQTTTEPPLISTTTVAFPSLIPECFLPYPTHPRAPPVFL